jgi:hypothetical protein
MDSERRTMPIPSIHDHPLRGWMDGRWMDPDGENDTCFVHLGGRFLLASRLRRRLARLPRVASAPQDVGRTLAASKDCRKSAP